MGAIYLPTLEDRRALAHVSARNPDDVYVACRMPVSIKGQPIRSAMMFIRVTDRHRMGKRGLVMTVHRGMTPVAPRRGPQEKKPPAWSEAKLKRMRERNAPLNIKMRKFDTRDLDSNSLAYLGERKIVRERDATAPVI